MIILHGFNRIKYLKSKKLKRERLNSAKYPKNFRNSFKGFDNNSFLNSQSNKNNLFEETKNSFNNYNSIYKLEKTKNTLNNKINEPIKNNNSKEKEKTDKCFITNQIEEKNEPKSKSIFLSYKGNCNNKRKKYTYNPINIDKFIFEINSFLLPNDQTFENLKIMINYRIIKKELEKNTDYYKLLKRNDIKNSFPIYEKFYKYIIKRTFKEVLKKAYSNNTLVDKKEIHDEYQKQLNEIKQFLIIQNKENENSFLESFEKNKFTPYKIYLKENKKHTIINIESHKKKRNMNKNNSFDNIFFHFYNFDKVSDEIQNQNVKYKNQELRNKKFKILLSFTDINKIFEKNQAKKTDFKIIPKIDVDVQSQNNHVNLNKMKTIPDFKNMKNKKISHDGNTRAKYYESKINYPKKKQLNELIKNKKNNIENKNEKPKTSVKNKRETIIKTENEEYKNLKLLFNKKKKTVKKNGDILNFLNEEKKINFSNLFIKENFEQYFLHKYKLKLETNSENEDEEKKSDENEKSEYLGEKVDNNLNQENENDAIDLSLQAQPKDNSSFLDNNSQQSFFTNKLFFDKSFFSFNNKPKKTIVQSYSQLFFKDTKPKESENEKKIFESFFKKKKFVKKKKIINRTFKDFIKDDLPKKKVVTINKKIEVINLVKKELNVDNKKENEKEKTKEEEKIKNEDRLKEKEKEKEKLIEEKKLDNQINNFKIRIQRLKNMSKNEFIDDTLRYINEMNDT